MHSLAFENFLEEIESQRISELKKKGFSFKQARPPSHRGPFFSCGAS